MTEFLTQISEEKFNVKLDLRYATDNNVTGEQLYREAICYLHTDAVFLLKKAITLASIQGYKIKIFDAFRPLLVQEYLFAKFSNNSAYDGFVSDPKRGATPHCRGVAIDLTLQDENENELDMGTEFDEFSTLAYHSCTTISKEAQRNRYILMGIMLSAGWDFYQKEWWHYQMFNPKNYPLLKTIL